MLHQALREMARYNRWQNRNLYSRLAELDDDRRKADLGLFFRSIHGTLNHILLADRVWLGRFVGQPFEAASLDQQLYAGFDELRDERALTDEAIIAFTDSLTEAGLAAELDYVTMTTGERRSLPMTRSMMHLFNHQTHHRGQVTAAMGSLGVACGLTDLAFLPASELAP